MGDAETPMPQETGATTIEVEPYDSETGNQGATNGIISMLARTNNITYDDERDAYVVGDSHR